MYKEDNEKVRAAVLGAVNGVSDDILNTKPSPEEWSPMQILDHLQLMESMVARNVQKQLTKSESEKARKKPIQLTVSRLIKVNAPKYVVPTNDFVSLEEMKKRLEASAELLDTVYKEASPEALEAKSLPHPVFGKVPLIQWFPFVGLHEKRHLKQLEKTLEKLHASSNK